MTPLVGRPLETFPVRLGDIEWRGELHATRRPKGRRVVVRGANSVLFDSDDCYDYANAMNALREWMAEVGRVVRPAVEIPALREVVMELAAIR